MRTSLLPLILCVASCLHAQTPAEPLPVSAFDYDRKLPIDLKETSRETREGVLIRDVTFANLTGGRTGAYLISPPKGGKHAAVLFVHWYDPPSKDSNRTQFVNQAVELAKSGTVSLLIDTMWSEPKWFPQRDPANDYEHSVRQVKELRRALDVLLAQPGIDRKRVAYVGHDFGMMYGMVLAGVDQRPKAYALQAGTASFSDWFLLGSKAKGEARQEIITKLAPLDPVLYIPKAEPAPVLLQFGNSDRFVPKAKADAILAATHEPKKALWYEAGHALNEQAVQDRQAWLKEQLHLR